MNTTHRLVMGNYNLALVGSPAAHVIKFGAKDIEKSYGDYSKLNTNQKAIYDALYKNYSKNGDPADIVH
jgi:hypothetical protein